MIHPSARPGMILNNYVEQFPRTIPNELFLGIVLGNGLDGPGMILQARNHPRNYSFK